MQSALQHLVLDAISSASDMSRGSVLCHTCPKEGAKLAEVTPTAHFECRSLCPDSQACSWDNPFFTPRPTAVTNAAATQLHWDFNAYVGGREAPLADELCVQVRAKVENASHSRRSVALNSCALNSGFGYAMELSPLPTICKGERPARPSKAHSSL